MKFFAASTEKKARPYSLPRIATQSPVLPSPLPPHCWCCSCCHTGSSDCSTSTNSRPTSALLEAVSKDTKQATSFSADILGGTLIMLMGPLPRDGARIRDDFHSISCRGLRDRNANPGLPPWLVGKITGFASIGITNLKKGIDRYPKAELPDLSVEDHAHAYATRNRSIVA